MFDTVNDNGGNAELRSRVRRVHNHVYANGSIKQHSRVFDEVAKVLFAKIAWERDGSPERFPDDLGSTPAEVASRLDRLYRSVLPDPQLGEPIQLSPAVLLEAATEFADVALLGTDSKGTAFQAIVGPQLRVEKGQFFTPDPAKHLLASVLAPRPNEVVLDPACGSAGLLMAVGRSRLAGIEIDPTIARLAGLGVLLQKNVQADIVATDGLAPWSDLQKRVGPDLGRDCVDVVITNPPFGSKGRVTDRAVLRDLPNLGGQRTSQVPELLFVERIIQWLKPGGRAGLVLPLGVLANASTQYVRDFVRREAHIVATVTLPPDTFRPVENGIQAALLFIRKKGGPRPRPSNCFKAIVNKIGYDHRERPVFRMADGKRQLDEDVTAVIDAWKDANRADKWF